MSDRERDGSAGDAAPNGSGGGTPAPEEASAAERATASEETTAPEEGTTTQGEGAPETAAEIARAVRERRVDPRRVVERSFRRIRERDPEIRAFLSLREDEALAEADALTARDDLDTLPLAGVPIAVKDNLDVAGLPTTAGSRATDGRPATEDAEVVARLRAAGAIVVGKAALPELGIWATTDGFWGATRNPRRPDRTPGGSSGGSAAAVAAGFVPLAVGNDGLGSVRIPAACCGVCGFKPTHGTAPLGIDGGDWYGMTANGPLARTVEDLALGWAVMEGAAPSAPSLARLRIGVSVRSTIAIGSVDPEWVAATVAAGERLREQGHDVDRADAPYGVLDALPVFARWFAGVAEAVDATVPRERRAALQRRTRTHARLGRWVRRLGGPRDGARRRVVRRYDAFLARFDAILTPALAAPPIEAEGWAGRSWFANMDANARYAPMSAPWNLAGTPAGVVPAGTHSDGTPLAVQVVAPRGRDAVVLAVMAALSRSRTVD